MRPYRRQPTRLPHPWDSPGKNTGMGWHFLLLHESEKWKWSRSAVSDSLRHHALQPTRLLRPCDFPGKSTGVGCHCLLRAWGIANIKSSRNIISWYGPVFLLIKAHGQRSLAGWGLWGHKVSDYWGTEGACVRAHTHTHTHIPTHTHGRLTILNNFLLYQSLNLIFSSSITKEEIAIIWL